MLPSPVNASMVAAVLCCLPRLAATVMVYSVPGSRSVRVVVVTSLGTVSWSKAKRTKHIYIYIYLTYRQLHNTRSQPGSLEDKSSVYGKLLVHSCKATYMCRVHYPLNVHPSGSLPQQWRQRRMCGWPCSGRWGPGPHPTPEWWCCR